MWNKENERRMMRGCIISAGVSTLGLVAVVTGAEALMRWEPTRGIIAESVVFGGAVTVCAGGLGFCAVLLASAHGEIRQHMRRNRRDR